MKYIAPYIPLITFAILGALALLKGYEGWWIILPLMFLSIIYASTLTSSTTTND